MSYAARTLKVARITGTGAAIPPRVVTNAEIAKVVETDDEWITSRTGIRERRVVTLDPPGTPGRDRTPTLDLAERASREALLAAGIEGAAIDLIVVATCTPDYPGFPATAPLLARRIGAARAASFDVSLACTGFVAALLTAEKFVATGGAQRALVVGVDVMSGIIDWKDRNTCIIFGDGAGAVILEASPAEGASAELLCGALSSDGSEDLLNVDPITRTVKMKGRETFRFAVQAFVSEIERAAAAIGKGLQDLTWIVPHQVNKRVMEAAADRMGVPLERVVMNIDRVGNTSAGSVPMALDELVRSGKLKQGDLVCLVAFGAGLAQGAAVIRW